MTTIKATCPTCGEVSLTPDEVELRVDDPVNGEAWYAFTCPTCLDVIRKPADERVVRLLVSGGVAVIEAPVAAEPRFAGPTITHDDLLDFHYLLQTEGWFDELCALVRS